MHIRDFNGERIIQALGDFRNYEICTACASEEVQAFLFPAKRLMAKCLPFVSLAVVGLVLTMALTLRDVMAALRALGPLAVLVGVSGVVSESRKVLRERDVLREMGRDDALERSAYNLMLKDAPRKYNDNDITYIPVNAKTLGMTAGELAGEYGLLPAVSRKAHTLMHEGE